MKLFTRIFPFLSWFRDYDRAALRADLISGVTVALVLVPQSMAYAQLAGLPAYYGLYAAFLPPVVASLFGSSRQLATGPVAVVSLMTSATLSPLAVAGSQEYIAYALILALMVGMFQFMLGVLRLGAVVNFLSHPVVNGFTNAAALIIATSQLSKLFGVYVDSAPHHYQTVYRVIDAAVYHTHWPTLAMAVIAFATMIILRRVNPRIPNVLIAVIITTMAAWAAGFETNETITLDQLGSDRAVDLVQNYNSAVHAGAMHEEKRAISRKTWERLAGSDARLCGRCHTPREFRPSVGDTTVRDDSGSRLDPDLVAVLHDRAALLDLYVADLRALASEYRRDLRRMLFVRGEGSDGQPRFYVGDQLPRDAKVTDGTWRLRVGETALDTDALTMHVGGAVVGHIPGGLPRIRWLDVDWDVVPKIFLGAIIISLLGFMEAISIAKAMATRTRQALDADQELIGQGLANMVGCMSHSYAVSGSFSRSAVNLQAGARTGLSNVFASVVVAIVLLFLAGGLYHLPQAVLAAIIMMAVLGLLNVNSFLHAWRINRFDGLTTLVTFGGTLMLAPHLEWGILAGVTLSLGGYLYRTMRPHLAETTLDVDGVMRPAARHGLKTCRYIATVSFEGPLNFASANYLESRILKAVSGLPEFKHLLIIGNGISEVDASGEETLRNLVNNLREAGYEVSFSGVSDRVLDTLKRSGLHDRIGPDSFYATSAGAIAAIFPSTHAGTDEVDCPYRLIMPPVIELSLHPDGSLRNAKHHNLRTCRHIAALRFDGPLDAANTAYLEQQVRDYVTDRPALRHIVFVSHAIPHIDNSGASKLADLVTRLRGVGYAVSFSGVKDEVLDILQRRGVIKTLGTENIYPTQLMAISGIYARAHTGSSEVDCPLLSMASRFTELSLHDTGTLREVEHYHLRTCRHVGILRFDGSTALLNRRACQSEFIRWAKTRSSVEHIVFVAGTLEHLDRVRANNLLDLVSAMKQSGYHITFGGFSDSAFETLARNGIADTIGVDRFYPSAPQAVTDVFTRAHRDDPDEDCPLSGLLPRFMELSLHEDGSLRDADRHGLARCERIVAVRFDGALDFATVGYFEDKLRTILTRRPSAKHILFAAHTLTALDPAAAQELPRLFTRLRQEGYWIALSGLRDFDVERLRTAEAERGQHAADAVYATQAKAIESIYAEAHRDSSEKRCPLMEVVYAHK